MTTDCGVQTESAAYALMRPRWALVEALLGGTEAMRKAGQEYLPMHTQETSAQYKERLSRSTLVNMFELTLEALAGKPFTDPVKVKDNVPDTIRALLPDIDARGTDLHTFARNIFRMGLAKGLVHVLIDFPRITVEPGKVRTLADDRDENVRPYWLLVRPENVIAMHSAFINGREVLTHVRIRETSTYHVNYQEVVRERIRVLEPGRFEVWELKEGGGPEEYVRIEEGDTSVDFIPLVTFYAGQRIDTMLCKPPLLDLAYLNVAHWQSSSDQRNILTVTRFPILAGSGVNTEDDESDVVVGPNRALFTSDPQGRYYYVEHTGAAIEAGRQDMLDLEERMSNFGAEFLKKTPAVFLTASARILNSSEALSKLQALTLEFMSFLNQCLGITAKWLKLPEGGEVEVNVEFMGFMDGEPSTLQMLTAARAARDISRVGYLREMRRRGILADDFDPEMDLEQLQEESDLFGNPPEGANQNFADEELEAQEKNAKAAAEIAAKAKAPAQDDGEVTDADSE